MQIGKKILIASVVCSRLLAWDTPEDRLPKRSVSPTVVAAVLVATPTDPVSVPRSPKRAIPLGDSSKPVVAYTWPGCWGSSGVLPTTPERMAVESRPSTPYSDIPGTGYVPF